MGHRRWLLSYHKWRRNKISFNNKVETRAAPVPLTGAQVLQQYQSFEQVEFGRKSNKRKRDEENRWHNWRKKSVFFELPYWKDLLVRHNLDVMHIEKNVCEALIGTILEISGKTKDTLNARMDLSDLNIKKKLQLRKNGNTFDIPEARYLVQVPKE